MRLMQPAKRPVLCFVSGWGVSAQLGVPLQQALADYCDVNLVALPKLNNPEADIEADLQDMRTTLKPHFDQADVIVGWSLGGLIAINYCDQYQVSQKKLITVAATPCFKSTATWQAINPETLDFFQRSLINSLSQLEQRFARLIAYPEPRQASRDIRQLLCWQPTERLSLSKQLTLLCDMDITGSLAKLNLPVLHIFADNDAIVPVVTANQIKQLNPSHQTRVIANAGHSLPYSNAKILAKHIQDFI